MKSKNVIENFLIILRENKYIHTTNNEKNLIELKKNIISSHNNNNNNIEGFSKICYKCKKSNTNLTLRQTQTFSRLADEIISCNLICDSCYANNDY